ncbi:MAG TPA: hypothetical protein VEX18_02865 [Polyangiaceae bacterium]|nr:hypothetical protein [Polyangiaceae bacterium]
MLDVSKPRFILGWFSATLIAATCGACSGTSDSETAFEPMGGTSSGSGGSSKGGATSAGTSGATSSTSGSSAGGKSSSAGSGGGATAGTSGGDDCESRAKITLGVHIVMNVTWPDTLATTKGTGQVHIWNRSNYDVEGSALSGETSPCGSILPPLQLSAIAGGDKALIEIPDATWDLASMPKIPASASLEAWSSGSKFTSTSSSALVGLTMDDPTSAWPGKGSMVMTVDHDEDTKPGILGVPKSDGGFARPPTSLLGGAGAVADQVYLVTRTAMALDGAMTSCTEQAGTVDVAFFDNHVVGCHVYNGDECDATQADFIDTNRTIFEVVDASYTAKFMDDAATCADVRAALPP